MENTKLKELKIKYKNALQRLEKMCREYGPENSESDFVTCSKCGSRYPKTYLFGHDGDFTPCRVCGDDHSLYSATSIKRIKDCQREVREIKDRLDIEQMRFDRQHPNESRFKQSLAQVRQEVEDMREECDDFDCEHEFYREIDLGDAVKIEASIGSQSRDYTIMKADGRIYD